MSELDEKQRIRERAKKLAESIGTPTPKPSSGAANTPEAPRTLGMPAPEMMDKKQLVESILELQAKLPIKKGSKPFRPAMLSREKNDKLREILGTMMDQALTIANSDTPPSPSDPRLEIKQTVGADGKIVASANVVSTPSLPNRDGVVERLFVAHTFFAGFAEKVSENKYIKETTHTDLKGLRDDFVSNKEELKRVIGRVYDQHGAAISPYLTPLNDYIAAMSFTVLGRAALNIKKDEPTSVPTPKREPLLQESVLIS